MRVLVISNDVTPGFGVPVAAPGLRSAGIAEGLRAHGIDVSLTVPTGVIEPLFPAGAPHPPAHTAVVNPTLLMDHIRDGSFDTVVFSNANMTPHLDAIGGVRFIFDMFAPKLLESLASGSPGRPWNEMAVEKERGFALADEIWVNGRRKLGYALGWMLRPTVDDVRQSQFGKPSLIEQDVLDQVRVVEMPVPLPDGVSNEPTRMNASTPLSLGVAGYAQQWSALPAIHPVHQLVVDSGHHLHGLVPHHWGARPEDEPSNQLPVETITHEGPLEFSEFARWVQSMDAMIDVFAPSAERYFAMITRTAVALRLGVPVLHGVDSEIADIIRECNAGWVIDPDDLDAWRRALEEMTDGAVVAEKRAGARLASQSRFAPKAALAGVARTLHERS